MSYLAKILEPGETIEHRARLHWFIYLPPLFILAAAAGLAWLATAPAVALDAAGFRGVTAGQIETLGTVFLVVAAVLALFGAVKLLAAFIARSTTEMAVTDRRVIVKRGFIRRVTAEINRAKVEGVHVDQSVLGRLLDFGTVEVKGTGGGTAPVDGVDSPIAFRNAVGVGRAGPNR